MKDDKEKALDDFLEKTESEIEKNKTTKTVILNEREGLIERLDKQYVTSDGRQLLRERY